MVSSSEHRRRVLEHQERQHRQPDAVPGRKSDPQLNMPLIGEATRPEPKEPVGAKRRAWKTGQGKLAL